jgi:hypothetical protein
VCQCDRKWIFKYHLFEGPVAQSVSLRPVIVDLRFRSQVRAFGIYGGHNGSVTVFSPSTSASLYQCHSNNATYSFIFHRHCIILAMGSVVALAPASPKES